MSESAIWKGYRGVTYQTEEWDYGPSEISCKLTYTGKHADVLKAAPKYGATVTGYTPLVVRAVNIKRAKNGRSTMLVTLSNKGEDSDSGGISFGPTTVIEIDWVQAELDIRTHPTFADLSADLKGKVDAYVKDKSATTLSAIGDATATKLAEKLAKGQDTYFAYYPVVRKTTRDTHRPTNGACGQVGTEPGDSPDGYTYLKTCDRGRRENGRWSREEEWTGFLSIDTDIYPVPT
jgi:hypothetical protein